MEATVVIDTHCEFVPPFQEGQCLYDIVYFTFALDVVNIIAG